VRVKATPTGKAAGTAGAEQQAVAWLAGLMRADPHKPRMTNGDLFAEAHEKFGVNERQFKRAKQKAIEQTRAIAWSSPGAKSKR
jgi:hypothetical protein